MNIRTKDALQIADSVLQTTGACIMSGDFASFHPCFELPQTIETFDGKRCIKDVQDLELIFVSMRAHLMKLGVTDYVRRCIAAEYVAPGIISVSHETRLMNGNFLLQPAYPVYGTLRLSENRWKVANGIYANVADPAINKALHATRKDD